jgi:hypothetical protein
MAQFPAPEVGIALTHFIVSMRSSTRLGGSTTYHARAKR